MSVEVRIPTMLRTYTSGEKLVQGSGADLNAVLEDLDSRHPGLRDRIVADGKLSQFVGVYVNDEDVRFLDGLSTAMSPGDEVMVVPAVAGG